MDFYLVWFDDDRKKTSDVKIEEAIAAYERRTGKYPNVVLLNERELTAPPANVRLQPRTYIQPSNFYVGIEEAA